MLRGSRSDIFAEETLAKMGRVMTDCTTETIKDAGHLVQGDNPVDFIAAAHIFDSPGCFPGIQRGA